MPGNPPLAGQCWRVTGEGCAARHAAALLRDLGATVTAGSRGSATERTVSLAVAPSPVADWARSGAMALTGRADGAPRAAPGYPASALRAALAVFGALTRVRTGSVPALPGVGLLGERAAIAGLTRRAPWSGGGAFRTVRAADGWVALSLPRTDDLALVPALVHGEPRDAPWPAVARWARHLTTRQATDRAQLLGLAAAPVPDELVADHPGPVGQVPDAQLRHRGAHARAGGTAVLTRAGAARDPDRPRPRVLDLTALWAGPLCSHLLGLAGADVVHVESTTRPDGTRSGPAGFFDLLHGGHSSVALDLTSQEGLASLRGLVSRADVVLEASRPRALSRLGISAQRAVDRGTVWTSITAYGRCGPWANRIGFGDDVAAAAGLLVRDGDELLPCGDALADPLTGVHAAVATAAALLDGHAHLVDVSMRDVAAAVTRHRTPHPASTVIRDQNGTWYVHDGASRHQVRAPRARRPELPGPRLGQHTADVLRRWGPR